MRERFSRAYGGEVTRFAAPVLREVFISDRYGVARSEPLEALVDTGADMSAIPLQIAESLRVEPIDYRSPGVATRTHSAQHPIYLVGVSAPGLTVEGLRVWGFHRSSVVLGRDFMQRLGLTLVCDFKRGTFALQVISPWKKAILRSLGF